MLKKIHLKLTILCTGATGMIFLVMSLLYLYVSEKNMTQSYLASFQNDLYHISNTLLDTEVISPRYLSAAEKQGNYMLSIEDNGSPLLYGTNAGNFRQQKRLSLLDEAKKQYDTISDGTETVLDSKKPYEQPSIPTYRLILSDGHTYYFSSLSLAKEYGFLHICALCDTASLKTSIQRQRLLFLSIGTGVLVVLYLFFYGLTKHLLKPVQENQKKQIEFVASASHELRTPLSVIFSCINLLADSNHSEHPRLLGIMRQEGDTMKRLIDEMLLLAGTDNHTFSLEKTEVELDTLVLNCAEAFEMMAREKGLTLSAGLPESVLAPCLCDETRIKQVLSILLHNAISYTPKGGSITLSLSHTGTVFEIRVVDTGIGILDADKKRIFERFYRTDKSRSQKEHFGLGLSIASEIIKAHKGSIRVIDTPKGGSTFVFTLPAPKPH